MEKSLSQILDDREQPALVARLPPRPCLCDSNPIEGLRQLFVEYFQSAGIAAGRDPAGRPVFVRQHGVVHGVFKVVESLPPEMRIGLFARETEYPVWARFSSDVQPGTSDLHGTIGIAMKLFGPNGAGASLPGIPADTHDFLLQNHDVFFVDTAKDMCEFTCEALHGGIDAYLAAHPETGRVLTEMEKTVGSVVESSYWSVLPYSFGSGRAVKYKLEPLDIPGAASSANSADPGYLRQDLRGRLRAAGTAFKFMLQFQTNEVDMPLDRAMLRWSEATSPPVHVATLVLPPQDLDARGLEAYGENLAFNPWNVPAEHTPLGSIAQARKEVYEASARRRRNVNGVPVGEPDAPRPPTDLDGATYPAARDTKIIRAAIHPAIGVARVGNSAEEYFLGPQVLEPEARPLHFFRDEKGALKREAAEFRIYGYNAAGEIVRELTADWAEIHWSAHLANQKAAWYQWAIALDIPEAAQTVLPLRNPKADSDDARRRLIIDGGKREVTGKNAMPAAFIGSFEDKVVYLGEIFTDAVGRLIVLAGHGDSASPSRSPVFDNGASLPFANSDGWYDDIADGPVTAQVRIDGREIEVEAAWVVTAPPNYAPTVKGVRTLYDLLHDLYVKAGWHSVAQAVSFTNDIYPIFRRLADQQWVNQAYASQFGHMGVFDFTDLLMIERLHVHPTDRKVFDPNAELRRLIFNSFRPADPIDGNQLPWPWLYGDAMDIPATTSPRQNASITHTQYEALRQWSLGNFDDDWGKVTAPRSINEVTLQDQPQMLDRAALEFCLADGFHPGCEVTWPIRHLSIYSKPFRIRHGGGEPVIARRKSTLDQKTALGRKGPLLEQGPGTLTRWMAVPWQADTAWCRSGYDKNYDEFAPSFWPARVPNHVLSDVDYAKAIHPDQTSAEKIRLFSNRTDWNNPLGNDTRQAMELMIEHFGSMGLLEARPGLENDAVVPPRVLVASFGPNLPSPPAPAAVAGGMVPMSGAGAQAASDRVHGPNFSSQEEARSAPLPVSRKAG